MENQKTIIFRDKDEYAAHLRRHVNARPLSDAQMELLITQSGRPNPVPIKSCHLCREPLDAIGTSTKASHSQIGKVEQPSSALSMYKHLASHLMLIASYSLPWSDNVEDNIVSDFSPSLITESSDDNNVLRPSNKQVLDDVQSSETPEILRFEDHDEVPEEYDKEEWAFLPVIAYKGQQNDNTLASFLKRACTELANQQRKNHQYNVHSSLYESQRSQIVSGRKKGVKSSSSPHFNPLESYTTTRRTAAVPCFFVNHPRMRHFIGRKDVIRQIDDILLAQSVRNVVTIAIDGMGGVGKTAIALEYAYRRRDQFDVILWINADSHQRLTEDFTQAAINLGLLKDTSEEALNNEVCRSLLLGWLSNPQPRGRWLLILDNVDQSNIIHDFWPHSGPGSILVIGRYPAIGVSISKNFHLKSLTSVESVALMSALTNRRVGGPELVALEKIVDHLGGLPLAVVAASSVISSYLLTYSNFLKQELEEILDIRENVGMTYHNLIARWRYDFSHLGSGASALISVLVCLRPGNIPECVLEEPSGSLDLSTYPTSKIDYLDSRSELQRLSLITRHRVGRVVFIHQLVQNAIRKSMEQEDVNRAFCTAIQLLESRWELHSLPEQHFVEDNHRRKELTPHVTHIFHTTKTLQKDAGLRDRLANLLNDAGLYVFATAFVFRENHSQYTGISFNVENLI